MGEFSHFDTNGNAIMVDVTAKDITERVAIAKGRILVCKEVYDKVSSNTIAKGDVLQVARIGGIMAIKNTATTIPMCHTLLITKASIDFKLYDETYEIEAISTVKTTGKTGVEMEALNGVSTALLTIYDMCKAIDKSMVLKNIHLEEKRGGKSGIYKNREVV